MGLFDGVTRVQDLAWAIAMGQQTTGIAAGRAQGYIVTASTANQAVRATAYVAPGANGQRSVVSTSANDTGAGTGAQTITITYLDAAFAVHVETVTLNGVTPVNTVGTNIAYVESILVATVGSSGFNNGTISLLTGTGGTGTTIGSIAIGDQQTWWAHHYVPAGVTAYILDYSSGATVNGGVSSLLHQAGLGAPGAPTDQVGQSIVHLAGDTREHAFMVPLALPGPDLVFVNEAPLAATSSKVVSGFTFIQG
jgi:hypothetical protein